MKPAFLASLCCPYCRSDLEIGAALATTPDTLRTGTLRCDCYEYPVVDGIPVLRQLSGISDAKDPAVELLKQGQVASARSHLFAVGSMVPPARNGAVVSTVRDLLRQGRAALRAKQSDPAVERQDGGLWQALENLRPGGFANYLYLRYANPSFIAAVAAMSALESVEEEAGERSRWLLDLGCGTGHSTAMLAAMYPSLPIVAADPDFVNLHILQRFFAPEAEAICVDAELPLPFRDDTFAATFCLDTFHYIRSKWALAHEMRRVTARDGLILVPHLHNRSVDNPSPGVPLHGAQYRRLFDNESVLLDESAVLQNFMTRGAFELLPGDVSQSASAFTLAVASAGAQKAYGARRRLRRAACGRSLMVNPIYTARQHGDKTSLEMHWPDARLEAECEAVTEYLPFTIDVDTSLLEQARLGRWSEDVASLVDRCILLPLPRGYLPRA